MNTMNIMTRATVLAVASVLISSSALALSCGVVSSSATSKTERRATLQAKKFAQREINRLHRLYGDSIEFERAKVRCRYRNAGVFCTLTQRYCIDDEDEPDDPPHDDDDLDPSAPQCRRWDWQCDAGRRSACIDYENYCQNDWR